MIHERVRDIEIDSLDTDFDDGRDVETRFSNDVTGIRFGIHPGPVFDFRGQAYFSKAESDPRFGVPTGFGLSGFSPVPAGDLDDESFKANVDLNDPFGIGLSFNLEYFDIGAQYVSILAARREADVLLTEGHDGTWVFPGPDNSAFGVFSGNPTRIGYGGWQGNAQQVATINVDNEFTDFDEPMAETVIGWKGITIVPTWTIGGLDLAAEYSKIDYNTNWQAWGDDSRAIENSIYPNFESDAGIGSYRNAYAPFQDKDTNIYLLRGKYLLDVGKGVDLFGKIKFIDETDDRMTDSRYLPYGPGDCPGGGQACVNNRRIYCQRQLDRRPLRQPAGHHRQRRHRLPVEAVRQPVRRRPQDRLPADPARRRLPDLGQPLRLADLRELQRRPVRRQHGLPGLPAPQHGRRPARQEQGHAGGQATPWAAPSSASTTSTTGVPSSRTSAAASCRSSPTRGSPTTSACPWARRASAAVSAAGTACSTATSSSSA